MDPTQHRPLAGHWPLAGQERLRAELVAAYAAPTRGYHDLRHLAEVLDHVADLVARELVGGDDPDAVRLAAWFHDAVYDGAPDDEERSAAWAERALPAAGVPAARVTETARLVRLTAGHRAAPGDRHGAVLCDADLAILAAPPERYAEYVAGVRREYARVDDAAFAAGRATVLRALLDQDPLFRTRTGRERWERAARDNLRRELAALGRAG